MTNKTFRLGRGNTFKTGQRVPRTGSYTDQYGVTTFHAAHSTFPPCIGRKGECAFRLPHTEWLFQNESAAQ